ncbi:hypothetical protein BD779DRAFT_1482223, partial [Infundibulicybe gibba]
MESRGSVRARKATVPRFTKAHGYQFGEEGRHGKPRVGGANAGRCQIVNKRPPSTPGRGSEKVKVGLSPGPPAALRRQAKIPKRSGAAMDDSGSEVDGTDSRHSLGGSDLAHPSESDDDMEVDDEAEQSNQESEDDSVDSYGSSEGFIDSQTMLEERANWRKLNSSDVDDDAGDTTLRAPSRPESIVSSDENTAFLDTDDFNPPLDPKEAPMLSQLASHSRLPQARAATESEDDLPIVSKARSKGRPAAVIKSREVMPITPKPRSKGHPTTKPCREVPRDMDLPSRPSLAAQ